MRVLGLRGASARNLAPCRTLHEIKCDPLCQRETGVTKSALVTVAADRSATISAWRSASARPRPALDLTPTAAAKIRELMAEEPDGETMVLRVAIQGGGCSGFQYGLGFDTRAADGDDASSSSRASTIVVDPSARRTSRARRSTSSRACRSPGSRSTTRTPPPRAVAATRSRWKRAPRAKTRPTPHAGGCGSGCSHCQPPRNRLTRSRASASLAATIWIAGACAGTWVREVVVVDPSETPRSRRRRPPRRDASPGSRPPIRAASSVTRANARTSPQP